MRRLLFVVGGVVAIVAGLRVVSAHEAADLPAGPIRDRHELMEGIGKNAKAIGDALKGGNLAPVAGAAEQIEASAAKITKLFPAGSTDPKSRAKPEIWANWANFERTAKYLQKTAGELALTAKAGGDVKAAAEQMFGACKSCHDDFRVPEKKKQ